MQLQVIVIVVVIKSSIVYNVVVLRAL